MADIVEQTAMRGGTMPNGLDIFDQLRFHGLSYIYHNYRANVMDKKTASSYKQSLLKELDILRKDYAFAIKCLDTAADRYKNTEKARNAYMLDRTIENADVMAAAIDGLERLT